MSQTSSAPDLAAARHTLSHLMTASVRRLFPVRGLGVGPTVDDGWYQDFAFERAVSTEDFAAIEAEMKELIDAKLPVTQKLVSPDEARQLFAGDEFKIELINELEKAGETQVSVFTIGDSFDLCAGPHVANTGELKNLGWKLDRLAGAYWRGDSAKAQMTRIYGLAFSDPKALRVELERRAEAGRRDHRKLGRELGLFTFSELVGPGLPLFTGKGTAIRKAIVARLRRLEKKYDYQEVSIPHICKKDLYEKSGHWKKFGDELFKVTGRDSEYVMKPMNCPHHAQIFASESRSYRDLPVRLSEDTRVYRDEQSGELIGLGRVLAITQDDAHIFCTVDQIQQEAKSIAHIIEDFYRALGMWGAEGSWVSLSVRDVKTPEKYMGEDKNWVKAEAALQAVSDDLKLDARRMEGEAAFYGPKLDFMFRDSLGRERQLATIQVDFVQPENLDLTYIDEAGNKVRPVMVHRAIAGSLERFMSVMIEHFGGAFPLWLAPVQTAILPVSDAHEARAREIALALREADFRPEVLPARETLGKRIREAETQKVPHILVIGDKEVETGGVTLRRRGSQAQESQDFAAYLGVLRAESEPGA